MALLRRTPMTELFTMRDALERFFDESTLGPWGMKPFARDIPLDVIEEDKNIIVKASVPGIKPEELHVEVEQDSLRIWGEMKEETERKDESYYLREHRYGRLERSTLLPYAVDAEKTKAEFENGLLTLTLPKVAEARRKEIKVHAK